MDNLAWAAALGKVLVAVLESPSAADQAVAWAGLARGRLGIPGKLVHSLQVQDILHRRAAVLGEVAQSHREGLEDNPQVLKDISLAVHLSLQRSPPG